jgi:hypothetical protein
VRAAEIGTDAVLFLGMGGTQPREADQFRVHLGFFNHQRIARCNGLHLGVGQRRGVQIFKPPNRHVATHHLRDELRLRLQRLPHIGVKAALRDVAKNLDDGILVSLPQNPPLALLHVRRSPRRVEMMQGDQPFLHIRPRTHLLRAAEKHTNLARAHITKQRQLGSIRIVILNEGDFVAGNSQPFQLLRRVVIDGETPGLSVWRGRRTQAGRNAPAWIPARLLKIFSTARFTLPCGSSGADGFISRRSNAAFRPSEVIFSMLSSLGSTRPVLNLSARAASDWTNALSSSVAGALTDGRLFAVQLRTRQVQHRGGLHVGGLAEHLHQLRHVDEPREAGVQPVARAVRRKFHRRHRLAERRRPRIEVMQIMFLQGVVLEIPLHGEHLGHAVCDRRPGGEHHAAATVH